MEDKIAECTGPVSFLVEMEDGKLVRRHQDQLRYRKESTVSPQETNYLPAEDVDISTRDEEQAVEQTSDVTRSQSVEEPVTETSDSGTMTNHLSLWLLHQRLLRLLLHQTVLVPVGIRRGVVVLLNIIEHHMRCLSVHFVFDALHVLCINLVLCVLEHAF